MSSCPYCGEGLVDGAAMCSRCGAVLEADAPLDLVELSEDELGGDDWDGMEGRGAADSASPADFSLGHGAGASKSAPCPHCDKPVPKKKHRCPSCGRSVRDLVDAEVWEEQSRYRTNVRTAVLGAAAFAVIALLLAVFLLRRGEVIPDNKSYVKSRPTELLATYGPDSRLSEASLAKLWRRQEGKWVVFSGKVTDLDTGGLFYEPFLRLAVGSATVHVMLAPDQAPKTSIGARARVDGKLVRYGDSPRFVLGLGSIVDP